MLRIVCLVVNLVVAADLAASTAWAQAPGAAAGSDWPPYPLTNPWRGPGYYFALYKLLLAWGLFVCWVKTTDWVNHGLSEARAGLRQVEQHRVLQLSGRLCADVVAHPLVPAVVHPAAGRLHCAAGHVTLCCAISRWSSRSRC